MKKEKSTAMKAAILFDKIAKLKIDCEIKCDALEEAAGAETREAYQALVEAHERNLLAIVNIIDEDPDA
jgi:hypothetical protein